MDGRSPARAYVGVASALLAACSADSGAGAGSAALPASSDAIAVLARARAAGVLGAAGTRDFVREGAWLAPVHVSPAQPYAPKPPAQPDIREEAARGVSRRADVWLAASGGAFRVEDRESRVGVTVRPSALAGEAEIVDGYVVYGARTAGEPYVIHRVTSEGTEDFAVFERAPSLAELSYRVVPEQGVAGLRLVGEVLELLDAGGAPRLRMAPPYVVDAEGARHRAQVSVRGCAYDTDPRAPWGRAVTPPGAPSCLVEVRWDEVSYPAVVDPAWTTTGSMTTARQAHTASVLAGGKVLVAGGTLGMSFLDSSEIYDPGTGTWAGTGSMSAARYGHTANVLLSGRVLVAGNATGVAGPAELYDPSNGTWSGTGSMSTARSRHTASLLPDGTVLVAGGTNGISALAGGEVYDPASGTWSGAGVMSSARAFHTASVLVNGRVLVAAGSGVAGDLTTAEIYDPSSGAWSNTGGLMLKHINPTASLLGDGRVLLAGDPGAEVYDPTSGTWSSTGPPSAIRSAHTASVLATGKVLVAGGQVMGSPTSSAEVYDPPTGTWSDAGSLAAARVGHTASVLADGRVLVAGGGGNQVLASAEVYAAAALGAACTGDGECVSEHCSDGVCCDTACSEPCDVCAVSLGATASGACALAPAGYASSSCGAYLCDGASTACPSTCATSAACAAGAPCVAGKCVKPLGQPCAAPAECGSGHCVLGVCCEAACDGVCMSCQHIWTGQPDGVCADVPNGLDPNDDCADEGTASCGNDGTCDGSGACRKYPPSEQCIKKDLKASGEACAGDSECWSGYCTTDHTCAIKGSGSSCDVAGRDAGDARWALCLWVGALLAGFARSRRRRGPYFRSMVHVPAAGAGPSHVVDSEWYTPDAVFPANVPSKTMSAMLPAPDIAPASSRSA